MKLTAILLLAFAGFATSTSLPTFTWLDHQTSPDGVPLLAIHFHDGKPDDAAVLKQVNPIARQPSETEESIDKCIFAGHLRDESDVYVTLTGGCPFEDKFDIQFKSSRLTEHMFKMNKGSIKAVQSITKSKGLIRDIALKPPGYKKPETKMTKETPQPRDYTIEVALNYDATFNDQFGEDGYNVIRRVANHAQNWYYHVTLGTRIEWTMGGNLGISERIDANANDLEYVGQYNEARYNTNVYMCYQNSESGVVGIAWLGTICGPQSYQTAVCEYFVDDMTSGEILAHEVGHNLGMDHDFVGSPGNDRYDSQGNICSNIGGVMDYYQEVSRWSTCSVEDFYNTNIQCLPESKK